MLPVPTQSCRSVLSCLLTGWLQNPQVKQGLPRQMLQKYLFLILWLYKHSTSKSGLAGAVLTDRILTQPLLDLFKFFKKTWIVVTSESEYVIVLAHVTCKLCTYPRGLDNLNSIPYQVGNPARRKSGAIYRSPLWLPLRGWWKRACLCTCCHIVSLAKIRAVPSSQNQDRKLAPH